MCELLRNGSSYDLYINNLETRMKMVDKIVHPDDREQAKAVEWTVTGLVMDQDCR